MATMVLDIGGTAIKSGLFDGETLSDIQETPDSHRGKAGGRPCGAAVKGHHRFIPGALLV